MLHRRLSASVAFPSVVALAFLMQGRAFAQGKRAASATQPPAAAPSEAGPTASSAAGSAPSPTPRTETPQEAKERAVTLAPKPSNTEVAPQVIRFVGDPISDGAIFSISLGFDILSQGLISSGELKPQQPVATAQLSAIDRFAVTQTVDPSAARRSNFGLYAAVLFAVGDPIATGLRAQSVQAFLVDAIMYGQSLALTGAATNIAKLAVRRPRPHAYADQQRLYDLYGKDKAPDITSTDDALSFFSGHASTVAATAATATYLAFARSPHTYRPWITLVVGTLLTTFVAYERVRAGEHFPTDVVAGALAGGGIGVLVPHLHREEALKQRPIWIGFQRVVGDGGVATVGAEF